MGAVGARAPTETKNAIKGKIMDFRGKFLGNFSLCTHIVSSKNAIISGILITYSNLYISRRLTIYFSFTFSDFKNTFFQSPY